MRVKPDGLLECLVEGDRGGDMRVFELIEYVGCRHEADVACPPAMSVRHGKADIILGRVEVGKRSRAEIDAGEWIRQSK
jgi:hypothetical protein